MLDSSPAAFMLHLELDEPLTASILFCFHQAYEKCFQDLHYMERYEDHTIAHAIQAKYGEPDGCLCILRYTSGLDR